MTEAVGYISGRSEVLCGVFFLAALLAARRWLLGAGRVWLVLAFGLWVGSLLSKEIGAIWPLVLLGYDRLVLAGDPEQSRRRWRRVLGPLLGLTVLAGLVRVAVLVLVENPGGAEIIWRYALVEVEVMFRYFSLLLSPADQSIFHQVSEVSWPPAPRMVLAADLAGGVAGHGVEARATRRRGDAGHGLVRAAAGAVVGAGPAESGRADGRAPGLPRRGRLLSCFRHRRRSRVGVFRHADAPQPAAAAILAGRLADGARRARPSCATRSGPTRCACGWTRRRRRPDIWVPHVMLGSALQERGAREEAIVAYRRAIRLRPSEQAAVHAAGPRAGRAGPAGGRPRDVPDAAGAGSRRRRWATTGWARSRCSSTSPTRRAGTTRTRWRTIPNDLAARQSLAMLYETVWQNPAEALRLCDEVRRMAPRTPDIDACIERNRARLSDSPAR